MKLCYKCWESKPLNDFHNDCYKFDGKKTSCKKCRSKDMKNRYAKSVGKTVDQIGISKNKINNGKKFCSKCGIWKGIKDFYKNNNYTNDLSYHCMLCYKNYGRQVTQPRCKILMTEFVRVRGGKCVCCGEKELDFLTIEHIKNKGYELIYDKKYALLKKLKNLNWPEGYTVLCWNCNCATRYGKVCPHFTSHLKNKMLKRQ